MEPTLTTRHQIITISRESELTRLYDEVMARENILLYAPTGMGKTYLANLLIEKLKGRRICFYLSLRGLLSFKALFEKLLQSVKTTSSGHQNLDYQLKRFFGEQPMPDADKPHSVLNFLEPMIATMERISQDFLFIIDDLHEWEPDTDLIGFFKTLCQSKNSQLLLMANQEIKDLKFCKARSLPPVNAGHLYFLEQPEGHINDLLNYSSGNTSFIIELLAQGVFTQHSLENGAKAVMEKYHAAFWRFRKRFTPLQWNLLCAIAVEGVVQQPHAFEFLVKYKLGAASSVERALKNLSDTQMIIHTSDGWAPCHITLHRWLQWAYNRYST